MGCNSHYSGHQTDLSGPEDDLQWVKIKMVLMEFRSCALLAEDDEG